MSHVWQPATEAEYLAQEAAKLNKDNIGKEAAPYIPTQRRKTNISNLTEGVIWHWGSKWEFENQDGRDHTLSNCTYIHHEPITDPRG